MWISIVVPVTLWVLLRVTLQKKAQTPPVSLTEAASHDCCSSSVAVSRLSVTYWPSEWSSPEPRASTARPPSNKELNPMSPPMAAYGTSQPTGRPRATLSDFVSTCQERFLRFYDEFIKYTRCQISVCPRTRVWWEELGWPHQQVKVLWNPEQEMPGKSMKELWTVVSVWMRWCHGSWKEWCTTHTFCTDGRQPRCAPAAGVCTGNGQGSSKSEGRTGMPDSGILEPGTARGGVAQKEPPQSRSCAACTWTQTRACVGEGVCCDQRGSPCCALLHLCVQKHCVSGPISLQSEPPGTP